MMSNLLITISSAIRRHCSRICLLNKQKQTSNNVPASTQEYTIQSQTVIKLKGRFGRNILSLTSPILQKYDPKLITGHCHNNLLNSLNCRVNTLYISSFIMPRCFPVTKDSTDSSKTTNVHVCTFYNLPASATPCCSMGNIFADLQTC